MEISYADKVNLKEIHNRIQGIPGTKEGLGKIEDLLLQACEIAHNYPGDRNQNNLLKDLVHIREKQFDEAKQYVNDKEKLELLIASIKADFKNVLNAFS